MQEYLNFIRPEKFSIINDKKKDIILFKNFNLKNKIIFFIKNLNLLTIVSQRLFLFL